MSGRRRLERADLWMGVGVGAGKAATGRDETEGLDSERRE